MTIFQITVPVTVTVTTDSDDNVVHVAEPYIDGDVSVNFDEGDAFVEETGKWHVATEAQRIVAERAIDEAVHAARTVARIHEALDGREWDDEFLPFIAGEIETCAVNGEAYRVRAPLSDCAFCDERTVEETSEYYVLPIDVRGPDDEYIGEAGDSVWICDTCRSSVEDEALRNHRGL